MPCEKGKLLKIIEICLKYILLKYSEEKYANLDCSFITHHKMITYMETMTQGKTLPPPWKSSCAHSLLICLLSFPNGKFADF